MHVTQSGNNYGFAMTSAKEMYSDFPMTLHFESIRSGSMPKGMKLTSEEYNLVKEWMQVLAKLQRKTNGSSKFAENYSRKTRIK